MNFLREAVRLAHSCEAKHLHSVRVKIRLEGNVVWDGDVEVFQLEGHPDASKCYAWGVIDDPDSLRAITMLHMPPITSANAAMKAYVAKAPTSWKKKEG